MFRKCRPLTPASLDGPRRWNAQVAVFLTYAAKRGHALIDRALYLPRSWTADPDRCAAAGIPENTAFSTKPALAATMITRAVQAGVPAAWMAGDEVYGADPTLRRTVREHRLGYVLQIAANRRVPTLADGRHRGIALKPIGPKGASTSD